MTVGAALRLVCFLLCIGACSAGSNEGSASGGSAGQAGGGAGGAGAGGASGGAGGTGGVGSTAGNAGMAGTGGSAGSTIAGSGGQGGSGGTTLDGGAEDAATNDASTAIARCQSARYCETFEDYELGEGLFGTWSRHGTNGEISIANDEKYGGEQSVRFTTNNNTGGKSAQIHLADVNVFPVPGNMYFGRMMFRLESVPESSVHWTFIESGGLIEGESYRAVYRYGGQHPIESDGFVGNQLMANYETPDSYGGNGPSSDCWLHADEVVVPVGRWACAEWQFDGPNNTMRFWLDGELIDSLTMTGTGEGCVHQPASYEWTAPTFESLDLGWISYQDDTTPRTLHVDDVVIDMERVGCP